MEQGNNPRVGIGVIILKEGKILLGKRKGSHGDGEYAFPGGHLEYMESFADCALREIAEECGLQVKNLRFQCAANIIKYNPKHYVLIGLVADWESGEPEVREPEKLELWGWYSLEELPQPLFEPSGILIDGYKTGNNYYDILAV